MSLKHTYLLKLLGQVSKAGLCIALLMVVTVSAADFTRGLTAYDAKDYHKAFQQWQPLAEQGDEYAQTGLGLLYHFGSGVAKDYQEAVRWYRLAAQQGSIVSQDMLLSLQNTMSGWNVKSNAANVVLVNLEKSVKTKVSGRVAFSQVGTKHLYFVIEYHHLQCEITKDSDKPATEIWFFNHRAISMAKVCTKYADSKNRYFYLTPENNADSKFVITTFRHAVKKVVIKTDTLRFKMPVKGFINVWNSVSLKAL